MCYIFDMKRWDYNIPKNWKPKTETEWVWFLERKINYGDWKGLTKPVLKKYKHKLHLDIGKKLMLAAYLEHYGAR